MTMIVVRAIDGRMRSTDHKIDSHDANTNAPSSNYLYEFGSVRWRTRGGWQEVYAAGADGVPTCGTVAALAAAYSEPGPNSRGVGRVSGSV